MSIEELLIERYKVIAPYPHSPYKVGDIIKPNNGRFVLTQTSYRDEFGETVYSEHLHKIETAKDYPHLFQPLPWWAERKLEEMPQYVKVIHEDIAKDTGRFCKVYKWHEYDDKWPRVKGDLGAEIEGYCPSYLQNKDFNFDGQVYGRVNAGHLLPATEADYTAYITQTQQQ